MHSNKQRKITKLGDGLMAVWFSDSGTNWIVGYYTQIETRWNGVSLYYIYGGKHWDASFSCGGFTLAEVEAEFKHLSEMFGHEDMTD